jgi:hypothetical protein
MFSTIIFAAILPSLILYCRQHTHNSGQALLRKCEVQMFKRTPREWEAKWTSSARKRELFADILSDNKSSSSDAKESKHTSSSTKPKGAATTPTSGGKDVRKETKRSSTVDRRDKRTVLPLLSRDIYIFANYTFELCYDWLLWIGIG